MALIQNYQKFAVLAKRESSFTDEKTGNLQTFRYVTGFDCSNSALYADLRIDENSPIKLNDLQENGVYDVVFTTKIVNGSKNTVTVSAASFIAHVGSLNVAWDKTK